jgi:hypothetical protein
MLTLTAQAQDASSLIVNEIMVSNVDEYVSPAFNFDGWIELYNPTSSTIPLAGLYFSDDANNLKMWHMPSTMDPVPANGYKVVWFGSNDMCTTNGQVELDTDGGTLYLSDANGNLKLSQTYPAGIERVAYARTTDGGTTWGTTSYPTPGKSNNGMVFASKQLAAPVVDLPSQLFTGSLTAKVTIPTGATLRYTTDGTLPTEESTESNGTFNITATTVLRFRLFEDGFLSSRVTTRSYLLKDKNYQLPVVSLVIDPDFLYDDSIGIAVVGKNGRIGFHNNRQPGNFYMDWDRYGNFCYMKDGKEVFNQDVDYTMTGAYSRTLITIGRPSPFKLKGSKEYGGNKNLSYPFFDAKPAIRNRTVIMRNGGNDYDARIKDPIMHTLIQTSGIDIDVQSYQPCHEFINGKYIGVLNMREPSNKHYAYANYGWDDDQMDCFEECIDSAYVQQCGDSQALDKLTTLSASAGNSEVYEEMKQLIDIDEFTNYIAMGLYTRRSDWPHNNIKAFRLHDGGKFRFVPNDLDVAFSTNNPFGQFAGEQYYNFEWMGRQEIKVVTIFLNLLKNDEYRQKFIDTYCIMGGSVFEPTRCDAVIDSLTNKVEAMMQLEGNSCLSSANSFKSSIDANQPTAASLIKNYSPMKLSGTTAQAAVLKSDAPGARLFLDNEEIPTGTFSGNVFKPTKLRAVAPAGYQFVGWLGSVTAATTAILDKGAYWRYYDQGTLTDDAWKEADFSYTSWASGMAPLGYNKSDLKTTISYGSDASNKYPIYYFVRDFNLTHEPTDANEYTLDFIADDGFICYINGQEAGRYNMPTGTSTYATTNAKGDPDTGTLVIPVSLLHSGLNRIAVEVHNCSAGSSDIYWNASIGYRVKDVDANIYSTDSEIALPDGSINLTASYKAMDAAELASEGISPVRVNEVSASNSAYINDYFKKNDWVELYNTTNAAIDLEGMYLSDDTTVPQKYKITKGSSAASTIIPAHGYKVIWCDKLEPMNALHASFKLDGAGGSVSLQAADGSWQDVLTYPAHDGNTTVGRFPDGCNQIYTMTTPTINKANVLSSYAAYLYEGKATGIEQVEMAAPSELKLNHAAGNLMVRTMKTNAVRLTIYMASGQNVLTTTVQVNDGYGSLSVESLSPGFYIAKVSDGSGRTATCKFTR